MAHPFSLAFALNLVATVHQFRREAHATIELAEAAMALCQEHGFAFWLSYGTRTRSVALATLRPGEEDISQMHRLLEAASHMKTYWFALLAEAYGKLGQVEEGLCVLAEALALVDKHEERWWEAELHRLKGELLLVLSTY